MCVDFSPFDVQTSVLKGVILVQHMVWNTSECVPHEPDKWTLSLEIWMKFTLSFCHIMSHDRMDLSFKWRILQCFEKKHVSKLFILNNYVKKLCGVQGNLYRVVRHKNMCNVLYLIATDTTLIKSNDASKSKLSLLWNWFFSISGIVAYPAGCTLVLYNPRKNKQQHIANPSKKTITSVGWWVENIVSFSFLGPRTNKQFCEPAHFPNNSQVCTCNLVAVTLALSGQSL